MECHRIRAIAGLLALVSALAGCQCCTRQLQIERPFQPEACLEDWDPVLGTCHQCGTCGGQSCPGFTPAMYLKHMRTCVAGGGEIYWSEWLNDPPEDCDPCDDCGQWVGARCCPPRWSDILRSGMLGQREVGMGLNSDAWEITEPDVALGPNGEVIVESPGDIPGEQSAPPAEATRAPDSPAPQLKTQPTPAAPVPERSVHRPHPQAQSVGFFPASVRSR